jgi:hypothetical protein
MKNNITIIAALFSLLTVGFGCSYIDNLSNSKDMTNSSRNGNSADANLTAKTGVAECDELIDLLNKDKSNPNDDFVTRKFKEYAIDFAKESIKENIEKNQGDKTKIAQGCKEARDEYIRSKEKNNSNENTTQKPDNTKSF